MVQVNLVFHLFTGKEILIVILSLKVGTDKSNVRWEDSLILNLPTLSLDPDTQVSGFVFYRITAAELLLLPAAESHFGSKVVQPRRSLSLCVLSLVHGFSTPAAGIAGHMPFGLLDCAHINTPNPADRCQIGMDRTGGITFFDDHCSDSKRIRIKLCGK